jgi:hypothetical protein
MAEDAASTSLLFETKNHPLDAEAKNGPRA